MNNNILAILTETDRDEVKIALKETIIERIRHDFELWDSYIFDIDTLDEIMNEILEDVKSEVKSSIKDVMMEKISSQMDLI